MTNTRAAKRIQWRNHIQNWKASGMSQNAYCKAHDIKPNQLWYWSRKFEQDESTTSDAPVFKHPDLASSAFIPVHAASSTTPSPSFTLELPNGIRLHDFLHVPLEQLQALVRALS